MEMPCWAEVPRRMEILRLRNSFAIAKLLLAQDDNSLRMTLRSDDNLPRMTIRSE